MVSRFTELGALLDPGRAPKVDKAAILVDAVRMVTLLRDEAQKLKESNESLQEKINELKVCLGFDILFGKERPKKGLKYMLILLIV